MIIVCTITILIAFVVHWKIVRDHTYQLSLTTWQEINETKQAILDVSVCIERLTIVLIYHDATVRGVNPETLGSTEELLTTLRKHP